MSGRGSSSGELPRTDGAAASDGMYRPSSSPMTAPFTGVDEHVTRLEGHFHRIDHHFDRIDQHFDRIDQHFDRIERRFDRSEQRSDLNCRGLEHRLLAALDRNLSDMLNRQMRTLVISQLAAVVAIVALAFVSG